STYYSTSDPTQVVVVSVPGLADLSGIGNTLRTAAIICLIAGSVLLLAGILGLALGKKPPAPTAPGQASPSAFPQQAPPGYSSQQYPQQPWGQQYPPQQPPGQQDQQQPGQSD